MSKIIELTEIIEVPTGAAYTKLSEYSSTSRWEHNIRLRSVYVNPDHVAILREDETWARKLSEGKVPKELDKRQEFTRIYLVCGGSYQNSNITVIGPPSHIINKLENKNNL